ncbi:gamma-glutamylcyclotransferase family protein [Aspergillus saccharolyticus JOP 1030-1]|uniref:gamma-glutamylcyclotransferase n=1 Tax=Aspergillus saccharolyticus JOP 1030-1 TaxID=1450539 RepID=A0A318Z555_9EURO|nr:hypothetical protein BP01DRAFT_138606 [Aspergillus saccharolyticus JOP 1030-1]PYH42189.1 hypothetical protein BP01DRAFT_138606 [Aspergillus saccharolyticus JOP 1030-1]
MHFHEPPTREYSFIPININTASTTVTTTNSAEEQSWYQSQRPLYLAYGSNLSPSQMSTRCIHNPTSSVPLAIARLPHWRWLICEQGYANVLPPPNLRVGPQTEVRDDKVPVAGTEDAVYGVLYAMDERDERLLDGFEGVDRDAPAAAPSGREDNVTAVPPQSVRPQEQGQGDYNKWVVEAEVVQWLENKVGASTVQVLVYVDELRVNLGPPKEEYIPRMNRAIRESVALGLPERWAEEVMRPSIPRD